MGAIPLSLTWSDFVLRPRLLVPPILASLPRVPAKTITNMISSLVTRVLRPVPLPHPYLVTPLRRDRAYYSTTSPTSFLSMLSPRAQRRTEVLEYVLTKAKQGASPVDLLTVTPLLTTKTTFLIQREPLTTSAPTQLPRADLISSCLCVSRMSRYLLSSMHTRWEVRISPTLLIQLWERLYLNGLVLRNYASSAGLSTEYLALYLAPPPHRLSSQRCCPYHDLCAKYLQLSPLQKLAAVFYSVALEKELKDTTPLTLDSWVSRYPLARQKELRLAYERLRGSTLVQTAHTKVRNFIKVEPMSKCSDPRNISPRNDATLSTLGPYFSAIEHSAASLPFLIKGCDIPNRSRKMSNLLGWSNYYEIDYSRFDLSISAEVLSQFEHAWVSLVYPPSDHPMFWQTLVATLVTSGFSEYGITYTLPGSRCSGDPHTSVGNGMLNAFLTWLVTYDKDCAFYCEGDDGIIGCADAIGGEIEIIPDLGFMLKIDRYDHIDDCSFCGMYLLDDGGRLHMYSDPIRTLSKIHVCCADGKPNNLIVAKALSLLNLNPSTPIVTAFCRHILRVVSSRLMNPRNRNRLTATIRRVAPWVVYFPFSYEPVHSQPTPAMRAAFAVRTGVSPALQQRYERYLLSLKYVPKEYVYLKRDVDLDGINTGLLGEFKSVLYA
ncbi:RNA-dependent RNA polymerase [Lake Sinai Virus SA1]|uniref:RNA-dependent RNA polymerase n=1 Tax=Lake Sinai Virus SA1 TaxID=1983562 RepID=UPI000A296405|nr:RNA-dependent RNA polymerase [Lake Sinai Virus SA1]ARO50062.1 RNA-dependent RNA polymerase [Lake Sinai Virus SA1]